MSNMKLLCMILRLKEMKIDGFEFKNRGKELYLGVKPYKNGCRCPQCQRRCPIVRHGTEPRCWNDLTVFGMRVLLLYAPKEIQCPVHGQLQEEIPWAAAHARSTYRLEYRICGLCQIMTQKAAAEILALASSTLSDALHRIITRVRAQHRIRGLVTLGVDEISYCKGHKYATIVYDLDRSCVVWVGKGKGRETIDRFFRECLSDDQRKRVQWASCDMSQTYIQAIKDHWRKNAIPPTIRAIQKATGINSTSLIRYYCIQLEKQKQIIRIESKPVPIEIYRSITGESSQ